LGVFAAVVVALAVGWVLFVPVADWLANHDVGHVTGASRTMRLQTARDAARGRLLTFGTGLFAAGALVFTARNFSLSREGQVTDRYTKAIEQLGSDKLDVRIGGIYALERIARDSRRDHPTVMEVLAAFVRDHSYEQWPLPVSSTDTRGSTRDRLTIVEALTAFVREKFRKERPLTTVSPPAPDRTTRTDVQAAITVIGRRVAKRDRERINLRGAVLTHAVLTRAHMVSADLTAADLTYADLTYADLTYADLNGANLNGAKLFGASLVHANVGGADLTGADLTAADLSYAGLKDVVFRGADLGGADLTGAGLTGAGLTGADLTGADLTGADLTGTLYSAGTPVPKGWVRDPGSGRLFRPGSGPHSIIKTARHGRH
jgi:Pentapeptide repeats (8 copies)